MTLSFTTPAPSARCPIDPQSSPSYVRRFGAIIFSVLATLLVSSHLHAVDQQGLRYTPAEVAIWKQRSLSGPYKSKGDLGAGTNSPGDWDRVVSYANKFLANPSADRFQMIGSTTSPMVVSAPCPNDPVMGPNGGMQGEALMDAAFIDLVNNTTTYFTTVRNELIWHATEPHLNFANRTFWVPSNDINPGFTIAEFMMRMLFAYDVYKGQFNAGDKATLDQWFSDAAAYYKDNLQSYYGSKYLSRAGTDYTLSQAGNDQNTNGSLHRLFYEANGTPSAANTGSLNRSYSNRTCDQALFLGAVGIFLNNSAYKTDAKRYYFEWLRYGVYPGNDISDMTRSIDTTTPDNEEKGWNYCSGVVDTMGSLCDVFARAGDTSLYDFSTTEGTFSSQGTPAKSMLGITQNFLKYLNGTYNRYNVPDGAAAHKIDGRDPGVSTLKMVFDIHAAIPNQYFLDATIKSNYLRSAAGMTPYAASPQTSGANAPWGGSGPKLPAILFMYGNMEGLTDPYFGAGLVTAPAFSPVGGTYTTTQSVTITSATSGATIRYTTNGTTPTTTTGTVYSGPVAINSTTTLKAIAYKTGMTTSAVTSAAYTINLAQVATPSFNPVGGIYTSTQNVAITSATSGASIRYTTNGTTPTSSSGTVYAGPVAISGTTTLKAIAYKSGMADSAVRSDTYTVSTGGVTVTFASGFANTALPAAQTDLFTAEFDVVPSISPIDGVVSLSAGTQTGYAGLATIVRFNSAGFIDARNGGAYTALSNIPFSAGVTYHLRMVIDVTSHTYSAYVKPAGGGEVPVGVNYAFRTEQAGVTLLDTWNAAVNNVPGGSITVSNFTITSVIPQVLAQYQFTSSSLASNDSHVDSTAGSFTNGAGYGTTSFSVGQRRVTGAGVAGTAAANNTAGEYFSFTTTPAAGKKLYLDSFSVDATRSTTSPDRITVFAIPNGGPNTGQTLTIIDNATVLLNTIDSYTATLSTAAYQGLNSIEIRIVFHGNNTANGSATNSVDDVVLNGATAP
jgi:hypothetical protein